VIKYEPPSGEAFFGGQMKFSIFEKDKLAKVNEAEYGRYSAFFNWIDEIDILEGTEERDSLLDEIETFGGNFGFLGSKVDINNISKGCRLCGEGKWSCLFINGMCNASCFYCPSRQDSLLNPSTNTLEFTSPESYADYVNRFDFKGVSFSGGEPFITFELMLKYLKVIRKRCSKDIHIWAYTNGSLVNEDLLKKLKDEGLNELRFDIGAYDYSLKKCELASKIIDTVTVEIPMIPDNLETVLNLLKQMKDAGIKHLNLHQLRVNPYNMPKMVERDYKFMHGRKVTVFGSEVAALKILLASIKDAGVPVNYCSYIFKEGFQSSATRKRYAANLTNEKSRITQNGYIVELADESSGFSVATYFNPTVNGNKKVASYKIASSEIDDIYGLIFHNGKTVIKDSGRIIENVPDFSPEGKSITSKEFYEIFNLEILRGGFSDYF
jgi:uncharacterized protein